jgi:hypothetical protein
MPKNIFDDLPSLSAPTRKELRDELDRYLSTDPEMMEDVLIWWHENRATFPRLSRMALDYLTIPGMPYISDMILNSTIYFSYICRCRAFIQPRPPCIIPCP